MKEMLRCVDCVLPLQVTEQGAGCAVCGRTYKKDKNGVWALLPKTLSSLAQEEIEFHDHFDEDAEDVHQLSAWRNLFYHQILWDQVQSLPKGSRMLEIGAGSGFDARHFIADYNLVVSDISVETIHRLLAKLPGSPTLACAVDAEHLPFAAASFDGVYAVAMWHHMTKPEHMIQECARVLAPGALLCIAIEPNATYFRPMKWLRPILMRITHTDSEHISHADAEMSGFTKKDIERAFEGGEWQSLEIRPVWFLAGYLHYGLEIVFRAFKLKRRIHIPLLLEKIIVGLDELLFKIPGMKYLGWHWTITARKAS